MRQSFLFIVLFSNAAAYSQNAMLSRGFIENFNDSVLHHFKYASSGIKSPLKWCSGQPSQAEPGTKVLLLAIDPQDSAGAGRGPEIRSDELTSFGSYSARLKVPDVRETQPNTGAVVGYFTYNMDPVYGLSEIDFEWLVADPTIIYIGTWTGTRGALHRIGRTINLAKGIIYNTIYKEGYRGVPTALSGAQNEPDTIAAIPHYDASARFYTYGFDWYPDRICWWIKDFETGRKTILWDYRGSQRGLPQHPAYYRTNFWYTNDWPVETNPASTERPLHSYELEVDWMSYVPMDK